jgi:hypothetical protein
MNDKWIDRPGEILLGPTEPWLMKSARIDDLERWALAKNVNLRKASVANVRTEADLFEQVRFLLTLPEWCANGWDPIEDAFQEILLSNTFPLFIAIAGLPELLAHNLHLGLQTCIQLSNLSRAFSIAGVQFASIYVVQTTDWAHSV